MGTQGDLWQRQHPELGHALAARAGVIGNATGPELSWISWDQQDHSSFVPALPSANARPAVSTSTSAGCMHSSYIVVIINACVVEKEG